jgi:UDP-glucuronate 4-epimerase
MKYLITGSSGFIGFHLAMRLLKNKKNFVYGIDSLNNYYSVNLKKKRTKLLKKNKNFFFKKLNLCNFTNLNNYILKVKPDIVFHLAGQPGVLYSFKNPNSYFLNNILATKNILNVLKNVKVKKFIFTSSSSVYGDQKKFPIKENYNLKPLNYYATTKVKCELLIKKDLKKIKIPYVIFRLFTVYGYLGRPDMLIYTLINKIKNNKKIILYNNGNNSRDFTFIDDVTEILTKGAILNSIKNEIFNVCASKPIKIIYLLKFIEKHLKTKINYVFDKIRKGEMLKTYGSNFFLKKKFNKKYFVDINRGLINIFNLEKIK